MPKQPKFISSEQTLMCRDRVIMQEVEKSFRAIENTFITIDNHFQNIEVNIKEIKDDTQFTSAILKFLLLACAKLP
jgi:hypothetical protein